MRAEHRRPARPRTTAPSSTLGGLRRVLDGFRAAQQAVLLHLRDFGRDLVERRLHRLAQEVARCPRSDSAVARWTSSCAASSRTASSARRASRMRTSCASNCPRSSCDASSAVRTCSRKVVERAQVLVELPLGRGDRRRAAPRGARCSAAAPRPGDDALLELARGVFETLHLDRERAAALDERRVRRLGLGGHPRLVVGRLARLEELPLRRRQLLVGRALLGLDALNRLPRLVLALFLRAQLLFRAATLDGDLLLLPRHAVGGFAGRGDLQVVTDDRLFLAMQLRLERGDRRFSRGDRRRRGPPVSSSSRTSVASSASARSRSSLISRLVVRMLRASSRAPPSTRCAPWKTSPSGRRHRYAVRSLARQRQGVRSRVAAPCARPAINARTASAGEIAGDQESPTRRPAAAFARDEGEPGGRVRVRAHDDVLEEIAERGVDGALVSLVDLDVVGDRAEMRHGVARIPPGSCARRRRIRRGRRRAPRAT